MVYRVAGKSGGLVVYITTAKISYSHIYMYIWRFHTEPPNLNPPIFLQWRFGAQPPNLILANISGYMVVTSCTCLFPRLVYQTSSSPKMYCLCCCPSLPPPPLQDPLLQHGWKTGAIIPELEDEIAHADEPEFKENLAEVLTVENLLQKRQVSKING
ncbi:MAG: HAD-IG family 5'-nucleotidase [Proteobacteria bacterium]|nr:HAD-IG family 5'-nucleotidase [Pseudomonadota bacterium]